MPPVALALTDCPGALCCVMNPRYEYKFVRLGEGWMGVNRNARSNYQDEVHKHARDGWCRSLRRA